MGGDKHSLPHPPTPPTPKTIHRRASDHAPPHTRACFMTSAKLIASSMPDGGGGRERQIGVAARGQAYCWCGSSRHPTHTGVRSI